MPGPRATPTGTVLSYEWFVYPEPGTYRGAVTILGANNELATVHVPPMPPAGPSTSFLAVTDNGQPPLTRYRRVVIKATEK